MQRILVVEDDARQRSAIARVLARRFWTSTANDGRDALVWIRALHRFDLILADLAMPRLDGVQLYLQLIEIAPVQANRVVFMCEAERPLSPRDLIDTIDKPLLVKPFEPSRLLATVEKLLARWSANRP